ncbi:unnamed protein product [Spirodela intermedia]|uniref:RING-type domain-containing protein n=1 Tax=Spirodela intermedia TaxID=51605 RepID=A0A7I8LLS8_SPIIN|nr:unnamed protein product [Spirodela intermedia]
MGHDGGRDRGLRHGRKTRTAVKQQFRQQTATEAQPVGGGGHPVPSPGAVAGRGGFLDDEDSPSGASCGESGWGYCTEEQLEELLLRNLDQVYREALAKLAALGYDEDLALSAVLRNGHCYGSMDAQSNIIQNSLAQIDSLSGPDPSSDGGGGSSAAFSDLRHLVEYSLAGMVCLLRQVRPHLTRGDAMWCLLMSDLHIGRASTIDVPVTPAIGAGGDDFAEDGNSDIELECARRFDLPPAMESLLRRNVAAFGIGFRARSKTPPMSTPAGSQLGPFSLNQSFEDGAGLGAGTRDSTDSDVVSPVLSGLEKLNIEEEKAIGEVAEDQKKEIIADIFREIRGLEEQLNERMEWAQDKAFQAAGKLSCDLSELRILRQDREETLNAKSTRQIMDDSSIKKIEDMEDALRKVSIEVDRANEVVRRLELENKELKAEMAASKLSASESAMMSMEIAKREKKSMKKLAAWEKQRIELQGSITEEKKKVEQLQQHSTQMKKAKTEMEGKLRQEMKAKEEAVARGEEERKAKEACEGGIRRKRDALRRKVEVDFQRHRDDIQRLQDELARLKSSPRPAALRSPLPTPPLPPSPVAAAVRHRAPVRAAAAEAAGRRECLTCRREVCVVFLPCAHQVLCASCSDNHEKKARARCPTCNLRIQRRIRVFGATA